MASDNIVHQLLCSSKTIGDPYLHRIALDFKKSSARKPLTFDTSQKPRQIGERKGGLSNINLISTPGLTSLTARQLIKWPDTTANG
ncbi:hypothetical protein CEXT_240531 [Caerostris extrusa]|uniref:Uncharacterized protein n=1 Tax=Caerostris extrusa TaxID=172846 RepID=A0AAV4QIX0_CAEEX|nr:hypothetical protein CEXT_240531 [Caerostris extrusa]